jgi:hypothetical protein
MSTGQKIKSFCDLSTVVMQQCTIKNNRLVNVHSYFLTWIKESLSFIEHLFGLFFGSCVIIEVRSRVDLASTRPVSALYMAILGPWWT